MTRDQIFSIVSEYFTVHLEVPTEKITLEANLFKDLGLDSIDALDMIAMLESKLDISVEEDDLKKIKTVNDIIEYILTAVQAKA
jgi:Acyl carrier protein